MTPSDLFNDSKFLLIEQLKHSDLKEFLTKTLKDKKSFVYKSFQVYLFLVLALFGAIVYYALLALIQTAEPFKLLQITFGLVFSFTVLIFIHEIIYAITFKAVGADNIYFGGDIKKFIFYTASDQTVISGAKFYLEV